MPQQASATTVGDATLTAEKSEDEAREDKRHRRSWIPSQFPDEQALPLTQNTFLALWWHQAQYVGQLWKIYFPKAFLRQHFVKVYRRPEDPTVPKKWTLLKTLCHTCLSEKAKQEVIETWDDTCLPLANCRLTIATYSRDIALGQQIQ